MQLASIISTWARIHACNQGEICRIFNCLSYSCNCDNSIFKWLTQCFNQIAWILWRFIQKQNSVVCKTHFSGSTSPITTDHCYGCCYVMWRPKWSSENNALFAVKCSCNTMYFGDFQGFLKCHIWKYAWKTLCKHSLSTSWWPNHNDIMSTCCSNFQCSFCCFLTFYITKIIWNRYSFLFVLIT